MLSPDSIAGRDMSYLVHSTTPTRIRAHTHTEMRTDPQSKALSIFSDFKSICTHTHIHRQVAHDHMLSPDSNAGRDMSYLMHYTTQKLRSLPLISVAAIEGGCVGGGAELSTSCMCFLYARTPSSQPVRPLSLSTHSKRVGVCRDDLLDAT